MFVGKGLGGSGVMNAMIYVRCTEEVRQGSYFFCLSDLCNDLLLLLVRILRDGMSMDGVIDMFSYRDKSIIMHLLVGIGTIQKEY